MVSAPNQSQSLRTYCRGPRRIRVLAYSTLYFLLLSGANALAQVEDNAPAPTNAILGRWVLFTRNCQEPEPEYFIFEAKSATQVLNADGTKQRYRFRKVEYAASQPNEITVNFNEEHGLGKLKSPTTITVKLEAPGIAWIVAKSRSDYRMLTKCP